ncbi:NB-ARC domain-containing protein [Saccharopolyspora antimicrobica]|uniref:NB-ARC domain-containing protein n=2 Tax=Saccharopolyspora antimicrobica TaxID=455193 RepID=A0ABX9TIE5_9PSEU|nr:NB-ARC domain-containing protein [Saccharopolyspora antimicrobica]RKT86828.1 NB-ARC domain-containing protein [Saccharopolyspora antimicrobica]
MPGDGGGMVEESGTRNEQSGTVNGPVAQVGAVHGGIHFNTSAGERLAPGQLPPDIASFAGQADELAALHAMVGDSARVAVISGAPGVGKTALAVHWANQVAQHFPDGQLYVNLRGSDAGDWPVSPTEVLRSFLEAMGETRIPADVAGRYRTLLAKKRVLVVLDDVRDLAQVRPLLPGGTTAFVVVTSRNQLTGLIAEGARSLPLDALGAAESRELLARALGEEQLSGEPQAVNEVIALCAGSPQALSIVAAHAASTPLAVLARELGEVLAPPGVGSWSERMASVLDWSARRSATPPGWKDRVAGLSWLRNQNALYAAAAAAAVATVITYTDVIAASSFFGLGYLLIRFGLLVVGLVWLERDGARGATGAGLSVGTAVFFVVDSLTSLHGAATVWAWLYFFAVIAFTAALASRLAPLRRVFRRRRLVRPSGRPLAYVVLGAVAVQFVLLFAGLPLEYGSTTVITGLGALGALLPVVSIGGLCAAVALTEVSDQQERSLAGAVVVAYHGPEVLLILSSLLLGTQFTYLGGGYWATDVEFAAWTVFAVAQAVLAAASTGATLALLRR